MIYDINKSLILEAVNGAWDTSMQNRQQALVNRDQALSATLDSNPGQYIFNPMVGGPISHIGNKLGQVYNQVPYELLKHKDSKELPTEATVQVDPNGQPWNAQMDSASESSKEYAQGTEDVKMNNPGQYYLNPFVAGPMNQGMANIQTSALDSTRSVLSPSTRMGSTLK